MRFKSSLLICTLLLTAATSARAAAPSLGQIYPRGGQRGTEVVFSFTGARLQDAQEILYYSPGFTTVKLEEVKPNAVKVRVSIAPDVPPGEYAARVRTESGITEMKTFYVGALPPVEEKEPNSEFDTPQEVPPNSTVEGVVQNEDVDYYVVEAKKGQRLCAEIEGVRLGMTLFDPYISIMDMKRFDLTLADDSPLLKQDAVASIVVPEDGKYVIQVRETAYRGNGNCRYRLHVGNFPRPKAVYPAGGMKGEQVEVRFLGDPSGEIKQSFKLPAESTDDFGVYAQTAEGIAPSANPFRVSDFGNALEAEPNEALAQATPAPLAAPLALNGIIEKPGDIDHFKFTAKKGQAFDVRCYARDIGSPLDPVMYLYNIKGGAIASNDDQGGPDSAFRFNVPADGEYVIRVQDHLGNGGPTYVYRVELAPPKATTSVTIPEFSRYSQERQAIAIPQGNRFATRFVIGRSNFGGDVNFKALNLPPGVRLEADTVPSNQGSFPAVFEAAPDAAIGGILTKVVAVPTDPNAKVEPTYYQKADLVRGSPGQSIYWSLNVDRIPVAVTKAVPFKINIVEPKVPLVQRGSMDLKIVAERKDGFNGVITVYPIWNPPGVSSATSVQIPAGKNEAVLRMNASPSAAVRKWKIAVFGVASHEGGATWVSSQLAALEVAPPYVQFAMQRAAAEQGQETEIVCNITQQVPFEGNAKVQLLGLPAKVTTEPMLEINKESKELVFKVKIDPASPPGRHKSVFCRVTVTKDGEPVVHDVGGTELRIDKPLPVVAKKPEPKKPEPKKPEPKKPVEKRLTRLEKLRLEQEAREKAAQEGKK